MSNEILQTGLTLVKSAVDADNLKNYSLASNLYDQAILNLKLALVSEKDPQKNALISSKIEEYSQRNKFIKNILSQQPQQQQSQQSQQQSSLMNFPSVPGTVSPSINNNNNNMNNNNMNNSINTSTLSSFPSFPSQPQQQNVTSDQLSKLNSLSIGNNSTAQRQLSRVEAYEAAKNFSFKGRKEEETKNYRSAIQCYEQACSYYLMAIKGEPDSIIKKSLSDEAKIYLDRIEVLKPFAQSQQPPSPTNSIGSNGSNSSIGSGINNNNMMYNSSNSNGIMYNNNSNNMMSSSLTSSTLSNFQPQQSQQQLLQSQFPSFNGSFIEPNNNMPIVQQQFLMNHQFNQSSNSFSNATSNIPQTFSGDKCAACNSILSTNSIKALDRMWHAECFQVSIICAGCQKPFALSNLSLKVKDNRAYHPMCFESTTGLYQEENRTFVGSSKSLFFSIQLQRKFYRAGETIQFGFVIDNGTSKKVDKVVAYLLMNETRMEITGSAYERKPKKSTKKLGRCEFMNSNRFPLIKDRFEGDFFYSIPPNIQPSEVTGVDASFVREYQLVVKCVGPPLKTMTIKLKFNLTILDKQ